jgi:hypothetical protein
MPTITISSRAHDAIRRSSTTASFNETGVQLPNGDWRVPLTSDTIDRLRQVQHAGETISDTIERILVFSTGGKLS